MWKEWKERLSDFYNRLTLRNLIWMSFSITAAIATISMGLSFYGRFSNQTTKQLQENHRSLMGEVNTQLTFYLSNMMKITEALAFRTIKDVDLSKNSLQEHFAVLYDTNRDYVKNIALFDEDGHALIVAPAGSLKEHVDVTSQSWFVQALNKTENVHFSLPHVQDLFNSVDPSYEWVVTMSRMVEITIDGQVKKGVLLIDMTYDGLKQLVGNISLGEKGYLYLMDQNGHVIYHPQRQRLLTGFAEESTETVIDKRDGSYYETFAGRRRQITVKTVGYTGWRLVAVMPASEADLSQLKNNIFFVFLFLFFMAALILINSIISNMVAKPIRQLELAVQRIENGQLDTRIRVSGFYEVRHLGYTLESMVEQIQKLMDDIVKEHQAKIKSEMDTLQSQINPHFLYNTLDIIVWMIENEQRSQAASVVTALARFFRISLSKGKQVISVADEIEHVTNYMMIQKMRFKNRFAYTVEIEPGSEALATLKLILQPLVENAIYHGMEFMDGDGLIEIRSYTDEENLYLTVRDNGLGMTEQQVETLMQGLIKSKGKGSGIGFANVNERIRLHFGDAYGVQVESEPDEGTLMIVKLPKRRYGEEIDR
ncbi:MAG: histidine kinase [Lachnospiraceae bacterium]|nr:histidine kinase [Lachnospiraceae bacterium]MDY5741989.1 histidine kinase [Lachnospiraceae bacterium]